MLQLKRLVIDVGSLAEGYKTAGQFMQIKVGDSKPGFFAIASAPDSNNQGLVEVLIKDGPPESAANLLCNISPGWHLSLFAPAILVPQLHCPDTRIVAYALSPIAH